MRYLLFFHKKNHNHSLSQQELSSFCINVILLEAYTQEEAQEIIQSNKNIAVFVSDTLNLSLFSLHKRQHKNSPIVLFSNQSFYEICTQSKTSIISHIIPNEPLYPGFLYATLRSILTPPHNGMLEYFSKEIPIQTLHCNEKNTHDTCSQVKSASDLFLRSTYKSSLCYSIAEELLMNAKKNLSPSHSITLQYASDHKKFGLSVTDNSGSLPAETFFQYAMKQLDQDSDIFMDKKKSGAGIGLSTIIHGCHALICICAPQKKTELLAFFFLNIPLLSIHKQPRALQFFEENS
jgi:hypothetical protein